MSLGHIPGAAARADGGERVPVPAARDSDEPLTTAPRASQSTVSGNRASGEAGFPTASLPVFMAGPSRSRRRVRLERDGFCGGKIPFSKTLLWGFFRPDVFASGQIRSGFPVAGETLPARLHVNRTSLDMR